MNITTQYLDKFYEKFSEIKRKGFIPATRKGSTGIGELFESELGKEEDNKANPDFYDIEIKTKRDISNSLLTLFTKAPNYPKKANTYLRENYGNINPEYGDLKILHTTVSSDRFNSHIGGYSFKISVDRENEKVYLLVKDSSKNTVENTGIYYTFKALEKTFNQKLKNLAVVFAENEKIDNIEHFHYISVDFYYNPNFDNFINLLEDGSIVMDIRIGVYHNPEKTNFGKTHDHGTGFRMKTQYLSELYSYHKVFE